jgi:hypothetical protein
MVSAYDHDSFSRTTAVVEPNLEVDDHSNPAIQVRPDGRLAVFYSTHGGGSMFYRVSAQPEDVSAWGPVQSVPTNTPGPWGYTYPNPLRLSAENKTYLFWRGGDFNPTFSTQRDGDSTWAPAQSLIRVVGERPYVKYDSNGRDQIHFAFTNEHPQQPGVTNIYYASYRAGDIQKADGTKIGTLGQPIAPEGADKVYDTTTDPYPGASDAWVHDTAIDSDGRPVIVFAVFASASDHRYFYARWTGSRWENHEITPAGGSMEADGTQPYYSGGITLDHEDPSRVYLSRQVAGVFEVETRTTSDGGASWSREAITANSSEQNVRPISPRGLIPFSGDMSVLWMRGAYDSYITYRTSIAALLANGGSAPVADVEHSPHKGQSPLEVAFDGSGSRDPDGRVTSWDWDFGDGATGSGAVSTHVYSHPGRYFPRLMVTDDSGARDTFVSEVEVEPPSAPSADTGSASSIQGTTATVHGTVDPNDRSTTYHFDYGTTPDYGETIPERAVTAVDDANHQVSADLAGLTAGQTYHYRLVAKNDAHETQGADRTFTAGSSPSSAYRSAVLSTPGLRSYWRLGEPSGSTAADEKNLAGGSYAGRFRVGDPGALVGDRDTSSNFDGLTGEMAAGGPTLSTAGSIEGWFLWRAGVGVMRDHTSSGGWIPAYDAGGALSYRVGGSTFNTGRSASSIRGGWHHLVVTKDGGNSAFYVDGQLVHTGSGAGNAAAAMPWHVMRNGTYNQYAEGSADDVAIYDTALPAAVVRDHFEIGSSDRNAPGTWIQGGPNGRTADNSPRFDISSDESGATFECRLDGPGQATGSPVPCTSPKAFTGLADGDYQLRVTAHDPAGNSDASPAVRAFTVDTTVPDTTISSAPATPTNDTTPTFSFSSTEAGSTFECAVDAAAFSPCASPHTTATLGNGQHQFQVRSRDQTGNTDQSAARAVFTVDATNPTATAPVQSLVTDGTLAMGSVDARLSWSGSDNLASASQLKYDFQQRVNSTGTWAAWASALSATPLTATTRSLNQAWTYQFQVRSRDSAGNVGSFSLGPAFRAYRYEESTSSPTLTYSGTWSTLTQGAASGGKVQSSGVVGAKATFSFSGRNVAVVMPKQTVLGTTTICLDPGTAAQSCSTVDLSPSAGFGDRKLVFTRNGLSTSLPHKVQVTVAAGRVDLDAFVVLR